MATLRITIDKRHPNSKGLYPIRIVFGANSKEAAYSPNVFIKLENWDKENCVVLPAEPKFKRKNAIIEEVFKEAEAFIEKLSNRDLLVNDAKKLRDMFLEKDKRVTFLEYYKRYVESMKVGRTREIYDDTYKKLEKEISKSLRFEEITTRWLTNLDKRWDNLSINTRSIHFRNIRAVFNSAIDDDIVGLELYPFRRFKIKNEETEKRALSLDTFRRLIAYSGSEQENWARDVFMLSFYLIGINMKDLYNLTDTYEGYITFNRAKTNRLYKIKLEPEALELIEKMRGKKSLLNFSEQFVLNSSLMKKVNDYLADICTALEIPKFTTYAARHSWATFASELDINEKTIAMALGHGKKDVTSTYIDFNMKKVEQANRMVIDSIKL